MQSLKLPSALFGKEFLLHKIQKFLLVPRESIICLRASFPQLETGPCRVVITKFTIVLCMSSLVLEFRLNRWRSLKSSLSNKLIVNAAALIT